VEDSPLLDAGEEDFAVTIRYRTTRNFGNIVQKGQNLTPGGYFKIENNDGIATCLVKHASDEQRAVTSGSPINDGQWHTVVCQRTSVDVRMYVDGVEVDHRDGPSGSISNDKPLTIGGKLDCDQIDVECDYFPGDIDFVQLEIGAIQPPPPPTPLLTPIVPSRLFDTRPGQSPNALRSVPTTQITPTTPLTVQATDLTGLVPATGVTAVSLNVAATNTTTGGYLTIYPCGDRNLVANVNWTTPNHTVSNAVIAPVSTTGTICIYASTPTDVVVDINGWFATSA